MAESFMGQVLGILHNYFIKTVYSDTFTIENGLLANVGDILVNGQYFRIVGSVLNDGVYQYPAEGLLDEEFTGEVWALAVPVGVVELCTDIENWLDKYGNVTMSPYSSESFGGYSYTKAQGSGSGAGAMAGSWQAVFNGRLNQWRKLP